MQIQRQALFWLLAAVGFILAIALLQDILLPFVAGIVIAYFVSPVADMLERIGLPRVLAALLIVVGATALIVLLLVFLVPILVTQTQQLVTALPDYMESLRTMVETSARERLGDRFDSVKSMIDQASRGMSENWGSVAAWAAESIWSRGLAIFNFLSLLLITPLVAFYVLVDWHPMLAKIDGWLPRDHASKLRMLANDINNAVSAFIRGQGTVCLILGTVYAIGLSLIGLKYGLLIGIMTGVMTFVPFVGWALGTLTATCLAVVQFWPELTPVLMVVGVFLFGQALDAGFLSPKIVGSKVGLHPVWLIFALIAFSYLFGFVGVLVAVPVAAAVGVLVRHGLNAYLDSSFYGEDGLASTPTPATTTQPTQSTTGTNTTP
ncbi:MAG: AI-2E family transporter [Hyphomicrobiaceae bacterium]